MERAHPLRVVEPRRCVRGPENPGEHRHLKTGAGSLVPGQRSPYWREQVVEVEQTVAELRIRLGERAKKLTEAAT